MDGWAAAVGGGSRWCAFLGRQNLYCAPHVRSLELPPVLLGQILSSKRQSDGEGLQLPPPPANGRPPSRGGPGAEKFNFEARSCLALRCRLLLGTSRESVVGFVRCACQSTPVPGIIINCARLAVRSFQHSRASTPEIQNTLAHK